MSGSQSGAYAEAELRLPCKNRLAFSSSRLRAALNFFPDRLMNIWTILIAEPIPPGDTFLLAIMRATSLAGLVNVPAGGEVDSVLTFLDHFLSGAAFLLSLEADFFFGGIVARSPGRHCAALATDFSVQLVPCSAR
jgi:hypothetical protein